MKEWLRGFKPKIQTKPSGRAFSQDEALWNKEVKDTLHKNIDERTEQLIRCGCANCFSSMREDLNVKYFGAKERVKNWHIGTFINSHRQLAPHLAELTNQIRAWESGETDIVDFKRKPKQ